MNLDINNVISQLRNWRQMRKFNLISLIVMSCFIIYYLLIILPLNYTVDHLKEYIATNQKNAVWMMRAGQEINRLKREVTVAPPATTESTFSLVNKHINEEGWNTNVADVHQVDGNKVQLNINSVPFTELMGWLKRLFEKTGIYIGEASLQRTEPGKAKATITLQKEI